MKELSRIVLGVVMCLPVVALAANPPATEPAAPAHGEHGGHAVPATLFSDLGHYHHPVSTQNAEAQKFFDQGLTLVFAFNHDEAVRSFRRAAELDGQLAMAWWGVALAMGPNINLPMDAQHGRDAYEAVQKAVAVSRNASEPEQAYIRALEKRYTKDPQPADRRALDEAYAKAMGELSERYGDDLDAATLYAESMMDLQPWNYWTGDGKPIGNAERIVAVLESVLKRNPDHPGANHYYIHAVEASSHPERALEAASRLPALVPGAGHLVHMPAHVYIRVGDYDAAAGSNRAAIDADEAYFKAAGQRGFYPMMYYSHNIHFLAVANALDGHYADAKAAADKLVAHVSPHLQAMPMLEGFAVTPLLIQTRFAKWDELLAAPAPEASQKVVTAVWHFARGMSYAAKGRAADAEGELKAFTTAKGAIAPDAMYSDVNKAGDVMEVAQRMLEAKIALAKGDKETGVKRLREATEAEDKLRYMEPPDWYIPPREALGFVLLRSGDAARAERAFRDDLEKHARSGRSLFGLMESLKAQKKDYAAQWIEPQVREAWRDADTPLRADDL